MSQAVFMDPYSEAGSIVCNTIDSINKADPQFQLGFFPDYSWILIQNIQKMSERPDFRKVTWLYILTVTAAQEGLFSSQVRQAGEDLRKVLNERYEEGFVEDGSM